MAHTLIRFLRGALIAATVMPPGVEAAHAQTPPLPLGQNLPTMPMIVCRSAEAAKAQAARSRQLAQRKPVSADEYELTVSDSCDIVRMVPHLEGQESSIAPFTAWAPEVDPRGEYDFSLAHNGAHHELKLGLALQRVRYYRAQIRDSDGHWSMAWIELPDSPTVLRYLRQRGEW